MELECVKEKQLNKNKTTNNNTIPPKGVQHSYKMPHPEAGIRWPLTKPYFSLAKVGLVLVEPKWLSISIRRKDTKITVNHMVHTLYCYLNK